MSTRVKINGPLNGTDLAEAVALTLGATNEDGRRAVEAVLDVIARSVIAGHQVNVTNFGTWIPVAAAERKGRNPQTGEVVVIPAKQDIRFRISPRLRELVRAADPTATIRKRPKSY